MGIISMLFAKITDLSGDNRVRRDAIECLRCLAVSALEPKNDPIAAC